uniref:Histidinol-phosphatase n=1 Tax=candidate division WOR-3 bacterium TaxID=2052148 RepID=A0A7C4YDF3_UNCW3
MNYYHRVNLHIHSNLSFDSELEPEFILEESKRRGFKLISITDHLDLNPKDPAYGCYDYNKSKMLFEELKKDKNIVLVFGVEIGYEKVREEEIKNYLKGKEFKLKIGSIHCMEDTIISDWMKNFDGYDIYSAGRKYFEELRNLVISGLFNVIGHFDYFKKYAKNVDLAKEVWKDNCILIEDILKKGLEKNIFPEINTSGIRQPPKETYPSLEILSIYKDIGGMFISLGSDAHKKEHIDYGIEEGEKILKRFGFKIIEF